MRKYLLLLLMLILPLQGLAAVLMPNSKAADVLPSAISCHAAHQVAADADAMSTVKIPRHAPAPDTTHDSASHLCCHQAYACAPLGIFSAPAQKFNGVSRFVLPLATLFIPDSPRRPPRG